MLVHNARFYSAHRANVNPSSGLPAVSELRGVRPHPVSRMPRNSLGWVLVTDRGVFSRGFFAFGQHKFFWAVLENLGGRPGVAAGNQLLSTPCARLSSSSRYRSTGCRTGWLPRCRYRLRKRRSSVNVKAMISQLISRLFVWWWQMCSKPYRFLASLKPWFSISQRLFAMR